MSEFLHELQNRVLVCDGAMGTILQQKGLPGGHCSEEWNISHPDVVRDIHMQYFDAGADIVETNSFGGNRFRLAFHGLQQKVIDYNNAAAELACAVRPAGRFVAGSVGPTGEFLAPMGERSEQELQEAFNEQIEALINGGVDLIIVETMADVQEARLAIDAAKNIKNDIPVVASLTFGQSATGLHTMMGTTPAAIVEQLPAFGADVIGANCGLGMDEMIEVVSQIRNKSDCLLIAQANAGAPILKGKHYVYAETPAERARSVEQLLTYKPNIIGGCCGTTPEHIAAVRKVVDAYIRERN